MAVHVVDDLGEHLAAIREDPGRRTELIPLLHEGASIYVGRGSAACGRIRARILATFGEVGLPVSALPFVIEALRTELNPEIVAGAAIAARGLPGSDGDLGRALVQALDNLRGRDAPVSLGDRGESTALLEILASLRWQPAVSPALVDAVRQLHDQHAPGWSARVRSASQQTITELADRAQRPSLVLGETPALLIMEEPAGTTGDLHEVTVQDHDGRILALADYPGSSRYRGRILLHPLPEPEQVLVDDHQAGRPATATRLILECQVSNSRRSPTTLASTCPTGWPLTPERAE